MTQAKVSKPTLAKTSSSQKSGAKQSNIANYYKATPSQHDSSARRTPLLYQQSTLGSEVVNSADGSPTSRTAPSNSNGISLSSSVCTTPEPTTSARQLLKRSARATKVLAVTEDSESEILPDDDDSVSDNEFHASASSVESEESEGVLSDTDEESADESLSEPDSKRPKISSKFKILSRESFPLTSHRRKDLCT